MELLLLMKANFRKKKGVFISIIILAFIVSISFISMINVNKNISNRANEALNDFNIGDLNVIINDLNTSDELINSVNNMDIVEKVDVINSVAGGININGTVERSNVFFTEYAPDKHPFKVYDDSLNKFVKDPLPLEEGEIYVPISFVDLYECEIGDKITLSFNEESKTFSIKAFIEEPLMGTSSIGIKMVFINNNDFNNLYKKRYIESDDSSISDENVLIGWNIVCIDKDKGNDMSMGQFKKEVNNSTQIIDLAFSSLSKEQSINYTSMFVNLISGIMYVFIIILFIATLIVMGHSITSTIEMDYVNLGILKSQGFTKRALRMYFLYQYFLAEGIGIILGIIGSLFFIPYLNKVFLSLTGLLASNKIAIFELIVFLIFIITISTIFIIIKTRKISKISPVCAISGGKEDFYFNSAINVNIEKRGLLSRIAFRQIISNKKQYFSATLIISILVFFMITVTALNNSIDDESLIKMFGSIDSDLSIKYNSTDLVEEVEEFLNKEIKVKESFGLVNRYFTIDGEEVLGQILEKPSYYESIIDGRIPKYDNEIIVTEIVADYLGKNIGDTVEITYKDIKKDFLIVGIYQCVNDLGNIFGMNVEGIRSFEPEFQSPYREYILEDKSALEDIVKTLNKKFGDSIEAKARTNDSIIDIVKLGVKIINIIIYVISILFILVVAIMLCGRMFINERKQLAIYKSIGFTIKNLRISFALRFLLISLLGSVLGIIFNMSINDFIMSTLLRFSGISNFKTEYTIITLLLPILIITVAFFIFSYIISRQIKNVNINELIVQ